MEDPSYFDLAMEGMMPEVITISESEYKVEQADENVPTCSQLVGKRLLIGKGAPVEFVELSKHEELVHSHLTPIQGVSVPVLLGSLQLRCPFSYDGIAEIVRLMFVGYAGRTLQASMTSIAID
ncbi:uncharacterized protein ATNIH1004_010478 [Aspergillus tanneri]|uniref:Uncharacterized protein n=1 Tax=Aspergillus tanneri TaxID=1220188 RepID=A0A5M9MEI6_9EURO|nr:uncharacterized protein ATNIH1004_010478 [Aspergillus tanneri]KAA8643704.1 hypothetical protein ATNIH1004_010478 [Aspergillus tanneri]